jgi:uncharacterized protein (TIGR02246 family)
MTESREAALARIRALNDAWRAAANEKDLDAMMAIYASDALELLPGMPALRGREEIRAFYSRLILEFPNFQHAFGFESAIVAESSDLAVMQGTYRFTPDAADPSMCSTGKYVGVWRLRGDAWTLVINISNDDGSVADTPSDSSSSKRPR